MLFRFHTEKIISKTLSLVVTNFWSYDFWPLSVKTFSKSAYVMTYAGDIFEIEPSFGEDRYNQKKKGLE